MKEFKHEALIPDFIQKCVHVQAYAELLESYNINVPRDFNQEVKNVSSKVGLRLPETYQS